MAGYRVTFSHVFLVAIFTFCYNFARLYICNKTGAIGSVPYMRNVNTNIATTRVSNRLFLHMSEHLFKKFHHYDLSVVVNDLHKI